jgi:DNA-binding transcriptional MerR regulator
MDTRSQNDVAEIDNELIDQLGLLETVDRRITPEHVAQRFRELLDDLGDNAEVGYRGPTACAAAGITYRQLDYWARTGLVEPSVRAAHGSGTQRLYSFRDILVLKVVKRLLDTGISLQQIRVAVQHLRDRGTDDLAEVTLMSDGVSVYELTSPDEVVDLLAGGQGVFGIALGRVWQEVAGELAAVRAEDAFVAVTPPPAGCADVRLSSG